MHYTTRLQILQEKNDAKLAGMMQATNALQIEAQIRNEEPPKMASAMAMNLREIVLGLPRYQRAEQNTFPGSEPNPKQTTQRFEDRAIPATGAGHISEEAA